MNTQEEAVMPDGLSGRFAAVPMDSPARCLVVAILLETELVAVNDDARRYWAPILRQAYPDLEKAATMLPMMDAPGRYYPRTTVWRHKVSAAIDARWLTWKIQNGQPIWLPTEKLLAFKQGE